MSFVSSIICFQVETNVVRYIFLCFFISGLYFTLPLILTWASEVIGLPVEKRAVVIAFASAVGNLSAVYGSRLWPTTDAPVYSTGFTSVACFTAIGSLVAALSPFLFKYLPRFPTREEIEIAEGQAVAEHGEQGLGRVSAREA
jgi:hypothetical protein